MLRWLFADTHFPIFLDRYYKNLSKKPETFIGLRERLFSENFGTSNYYSKHMRELGDETEDFILNDLNLQRQWLREHAVKSSGFFKLFVLSLIEQKFGFEGELMSFQIFERQVERLKPDIVYLKTVNYLPAEWIYRLKRYCRLVVGQVAYRIRSPDDLTAYDLLISSLPNLVARFRRRGMKAEFLKIAFEPSILKQLKKTKQKFAVVFIGGFNEVHDQGTRILEEIARKIPIDVWGYREDRLSHNSPLRHNFHGQIWGTEMFKVLYNSRIVLNRHSRIAGEYANNMRLYETTGVGSLLITDNKKNIGELFVPGKEVIVYNNAEDAAEKIRYFLSHEPERKRIAKAGQKRTLTEHTYLNRMKELKAIVEKYLKA